MALESIQPVQPKRPKRSVLENALRLLDTATSLGLQAANVFGVGQTKDSLPELKVPQAPKPSFEFKQPLIFRR